MCLQQDGRVEERVVEGAARALRRLAPQPGHHALSEALSRRGELAQAFPLSDLVEKHDVQLLKWRVARDRVLLAPAQQHAAPRVLLGPLQVDALFTDPAHHGRTAQRPVMPV